jgi:hypothetical protein
VEDEAPLLRGVMAQDGSGALYPWERVARVTPPGSVSVTASLPMPTLRPERAPLVELRRQE